MVDSFENIEEIFNNVIAKHIIYDNYPSSYIGGTRPGRIIYDFEHITSIYKSIFKKYAYTIKIEEEQITINEYSVNYCYSNEINLETMLSTQLKNRKARTNLYICRLDDMSKYLDSVILEIKSIYMTSGNMNQFNILINKDEFIFHTVAIVKDANSQDCHAIGIMIYKYTTYEDNKENYIIIIKNTGLGIEYHNITQDIENVDGIIVLQFKEQIGNNIIRDKLRLFYFYIINFIIPVDIFYVILIRQILFDHIISKDTNLYLYDNESVVKTYKLEPQIIGNCMTLSFFLLFEGIDIIKKIKSNKNINIKDALKDHIVKNSKNLHDELKYELLQKCITCLTDKYNDISNKMFQNIDSYDWLYDTSQVIIEISRIFNRTYNINTLNTQIDDLELCIKKYITNYNTLHYICSDKIKKSDTYNIVNDIGLVKSIHIADIIECDEIYKNINKLLYKGNITNYEEIIKLLYTLSQTSCMLKNSLMLCKYYELFINKQITSILLNFNKNNTNLTNKIIKYIYVICLNFIKGYSIINKIDYAFVKSKTNIILQNNSFKIPMVLFMLLLIKSNKISNKQETNEQERKEQLNYIKNILLFDISITNNYEYEAVEEINILIDTVFDKFDEYLIYTKEKINIVETCEEYEESNKIYSFKKDNEFISFDAQSGRSYMITEITTRDDQIKSTLKILLDTENKLNDYENIYTVEEIVNSDIENRKDKFNRNCVIKTLLCIFLNSTHDIYRNKTNLLHLHIKPVIYDATNTYYKLARIDSQNIIYEIHKYLNIEHTQIDDITNIYLFSKSMCIKYGSININNTDIDKYMSLTYEHNKSTLKLLIENNELENILDNIIKQIQHILKNETEFYIKLIYFNCIIVVFQFYKIKKIKIKDEIIQMIKKINKIYNNIVLEYVI